eukprot:scaffold111_cov404-Prasinococcus_capsulatus_cf.AAC.16
MTYEGHSKGPLKLRVPKQLVDKHCQGLAGRLGAFQGRSRDHTVQEAWGMAQCRSKERLDSRAVLTKAAQPLGEGKHKGL